MITEHLTGSMNSCPSVNFEQCISLQRGTKCQGGHKIPLLQEIGGEEANVHCRGNDIMIPSQEKMADRYVQDLATYEVDKIKKKCLEWLEENFGILARQLIDFEISQKNEADLIFGITTVEFSFEAPSGEIMESAAFLDDCDSCQESEEYLSL